MLLTPRTLPAEPEFRSDGSGEDRRKPEAGSETAPTLPGRIPDRTPGGRHPDGMTAAVQAEGLTKYYGRRRGLDDLTI
ncbi:hypothetical protein AB0C18_05775 [Nonomuraea muscovyensis]|uniref:hypothetical protein n=1 Tax=Nonomuraea muscovyensis TaxID=1124761 RepID=UPI0033DFD1F9